MFTKFVNNFFIEKNHGIAHGSKAVNHFHHISSLRGLCPRQSPGKVRYALSEILTDMHAYPQDDVTPELYVKSENLILEMSL